MTDGTHRASPGPLLNNQTYDRLKTLVVLILPSLSAFYFTIAQMWDLPYAEPIVGSIAALATLLGAVLKVSSKSYDATKYDGELRAVKLDEDSPTELLLTLDNHVEQIREKQEVTFKVVTR